MTRTMIFENRYVQDNPFRQAINERYHKDETAAVQELLAKARFSTAEKARTTALARSLVEGVRETQRRSGGLDAFLHEYGLSSREGIVLMCLAEALLRVPDAETANRLIQEKLSDAAWEEHLGRSDSVFVNASTWGLMLTGRVIRLGRPEKAGVNQAVGRLVSRSGEPIIRQALVQAMRILGRQFVLGRTVKEALERAAVGQTHGYCYSFDMLGEAARTQEDADRYFESYDAAIAAIGKNGGNGQTLFQRSGISIKLSALHPRYEHAKRTRVANELVPRLESLVKHAREVSVSVAVDAEEADRLDLSLDVFDAVANTDGVKGWDGFGFVVQAYQKRGLAVLDWLAEQAAEQGRRIPVRLVKGAYWDTEIKLAQQLGLDGYPVFTRKPSTDVSYLACAKRLFSDIGHFYPQFATHNAHTVAAVKTLADTAGAGPEHFEFQRLHGMGAELYDQVVGPDKWDIPVRVYAPVGGHEDLLAYLVRRLLENGANTSFVNRIVDESLPIESIISDPVDEVAALNQVPHPRIPLPKAMFGDERRNARGIDLSDHFGLNDLAGAMEACAETPWQAAPIVGGQTIDGDALPVRDPADNRHQVGSVVPADRETVRSAITRADAAQPDWDRRPAVERAACLDRVADLYEEHTAELMALCVREAGKTIVDSVAEIREAVDFCRYYAARARADFGGPVALPGPTGERNEISLHGRGVFACISPWNFPLAIFTGQVSAALAAGNAVIAKPAEQTSLIATRAVQMMHEAGIPGDVLHLVPGDGPTVGAALVGDPDIAGVAFTGSTETARLINRTLAAKDGPIVPFIAETGGQNAMLVDSTALPEQVVRDVVLSSFASAGQRCSALRVLFVQDVVADKIIAMLAGAMDELDVGDPAHLKTDVGPVIDAQALKVLDDHAVRMDAEAKLVRRVELPATCAHGTFFAPRAYEIDRLDLLTREVFGPVLHIIRYNASDLDAVCDAVNGTGYGLTLGVHSRIDATAQHVCSRIRAGNSYVNRNMIGAVVGVQPFGGEGLSGTGPKAGGPRYLHRFATERTQSVDTTAAGGNAALLSLEESDD